jgi:hypothetical protein
LLHFLLLIVLLYILRKQFPEVRAIFAVQQEQCLRKHMVWNRE